MPDAATSLAHGANPVTASGDKLLGGPQAGLLLGDEPLVRRLLRHPLARALRVDKLTLAALEATVSGPLPPVARSLSADPQLLSERNVPLDGAYLRVSAKRAPGATASAARPAGQLPARISAAVETLLDGFASDQFTAPDAERLAALGLDARALAAAARVGLLLRVADQIVLAPGADKEAARILASLPQPFTTSQARQALGTSRRVAIPLLEYLDRARVTERLPGDQRRIRP